MYNSDLSDRPTAPVTLQFPPPEISKSSEFPPGHARRRFLSRIGAAILAFLGLELAIFHSGFYTRILEPESTTGQYELILQNEIRRPTPDHNQVLAVGHSRMALLPRIANESTPQTGYTYASIALGGTTPRCWYYGLRAVDPTRHRYAAILIPVDDYNEPDRYDYIGDRESDAHYLVSRLGIPDAPEFALSYSTRRLQAKMLWEVLFKSYVYRQDFQAFLPDPKARLEKVRLYRRESAGWYYGFNGDEFSLAGISVDWNDQTIHYPEGLNQGERNLVHNVLFEPLPPQTGQMTEYFRHWYGRIAQYYEGTGTKLVFLRVPRGPVIAPVLPPVKQHSAVRDLASHPGVTVMDEHFFDPLEKPELFGDALHLNRAGLAEFSRMLAAEMPRILKQAN